MFGRYSLDKPGLILASQGETLDDYYAQIPDPSFEPDADNVIPVTETDCFEDDIVARFRRFLTVAFGKENLAANIAYIEQVLGKSIRKYFVNDFYNDHVKMYSNRPIYWEYSSQTNNKGAFKRWCICIGIRRKPRVRCSIIYVTTSTKSPTSPIAWSVPTAPRTRSRPPNYARPFLSARITRTRPCTHWLPAIWKWIWTTACW